MESQITQIFSLSFVMLSLMIAGLTYVIRKTGEFVMHKYNVDPKSKFWEGFLLPIFPVVIGFLFGFVKDFPYPDALKASFYARMTFGCVAGLASGWLYKLGKSIVNSKLSDKDKIE